MNAGYQPVIKRIWTSSCWWIDYQPVTQKCPDVCSWWNADYQPGTQMCPNVCSWWDNGHQHKRDWTSVAADMFFRSVCRHVHNVYYRMRERCLKCESVASFNARALLKNISIIFFRTQHHLVEIDKRPAKFGYRKSGTQARVLSQHSRMGTARIRMTQKEGMKKISRWPTYSSDVL